MRALWGMLGATPTPSPTPAPSWSSVGCWQLTAKSLSPRNCLKLKGTVKPQVCPLPWGTLSATTGVKKPDPSQLRKIPAPKILPGVDQRPLLQLPQKERQRQTETEGLQGPVAHHQTLLSFIFSCFELCASVHFFICLRFFLKYFSQTIPWISELYFFFLTLTSKKYFVWL